MTSLPKSRIIAACCSKVPKVERSLEPAGGSRSERGVHVVAARRFAVALDLLDGVAGRAPEQAVARDLLGAAVFTGVDASEEPLLDLVLDRLAPVLHQAVDVGGQDVALDLATGRDAPRIAVQDPGGSGGGTRARVAVDLQARLRRKNICWSYSIVNATPPQIWAHARVVSR